MHWVIQRDIFKPGNYDLLTNALTRLGIEYTPVAIRNGTYELEPDLRLTGKVYICGAIKLAKIAHDRGWKPGSFLTADFNLATWQQQLGSEMLNAVMNSGTFSTIEVDPAVKFFIRPLEDNKAFDGMVMDREMLDAWRRDPAKANLANLEVTVSPVKEIYREYRLFVVQGRVVTGSTYKIGGKPSISDCVEDDVIAYADTIIATWTPADSFVMDVCLCDAGFKVIEFNNINSSGFYASNVAKYVEAIQSAYS